MISDSEFVALDHHQLPVRLLLHVEVAGTVHNSPVLVPVIPDQSLASSAPHFIQCSLEVEIARELSNNSLRTFR